MPGMAYADFMFLMPALCLIHLAASISVAPSHRRFNGTTLPVSAWTPNPSLLRHLPLVSSIGANTASPALHSLGSAGTVVPFDLSLPYVLFPSGRVSDPYLTYVCFRELTTAGYTLICSPTYQNCGLIHVVLFFNNFNLNIQYCCQLNHRCSYSCRCTCRWLSYCTGCM